MMKWWNSLPALGKLLIIAAVIVLVFLLVLWIRKLIIHAGEKKDPKQTVNDAEDEIKNLMQQGESLSHPAADYSGAADTIKKLLDGCEIFGSELDAVKEVIRVVQKRIDWAYLVKVFGVKEIDDCGIMTGSTEYSLTSLLKDQLDTAGYAIINTPAGNTTWKFSGFVERSLNVLETYFKQKGITF